MAGVSKFHNLIDFDVPGNSEDNADGSFLKFHVETPAYVFCVDGGSKMLNATDTDTSPLLLSLQCIRQIVRNYIVTSSKCYVSILLTGCQKMDNDMNIKNISTIKAMGTVNVDTMSSIDKLISDISNGKYATGYGVGSLSLSNTLWGAATILTNLKSKVKKKIVLFTSEDNPCSNNNIERTRTFAKVADLEKLKVEFNVLPIGESFQMKTFYEEVLSFSGNDLELSKTYISVSLDDLLSHFNDIQRRHVALSSIPFYLCDDLHIDVSVHSLVRKAKIPFKTTLNSATNHVVTSKLQRYDAETGEGVKAENVVKYESLAGKNVFFDSTEIKNLKAVAERKLRLMGFKDASELTFELHIKPSAFIYPSKTKDGSDLFQALLECCGRSKKVAICSYCPRATSTVRFVALKPQLEDSNNSIPAGFIVVILPFGDEIRDWTEDCIGKSRASEEQVKLMTNVIKKLRIDYSPKSFPNPQLANHWAVVEAIALELPEREHPTDETLPNYDFMEKRLKGLPDIIQNNIYTEGYSVDRPPPKKKASTTDLAIDFSAVEELATQQELEKLKVDQLKGYLKQVGKGQGLSKMNKKTLVSEIYRHLKLPH